MADLPSLLERVTLLNWLDLPGSSFSPQEAEEALRRLLPLLRLSCGRGGGRIIVGKAKQLE